MPELSDFTNAKLQHAEIAALARLHLFFTARTHEMISDFSKRVGGRVISAAESDGTLSLTQAFRVQQSMSGWWNDLMSAWVEELQKAREVAVRLPFGWAAEMHGRLVEGQTLEVESQVPGSKYLEEAKIRGFSSLRDKTGVFYPQSKVLVDAAANHLYGDGLNLSQRIWQMSNESMTQMQNVLLQGVQNGSSALDIAKELEVYLGANADCPRWTSTRLYRMTKKEIASGDLRGLVSGDACDGQGVAYNALRLARTEIQKVHALATDRVMANSPWVEMEQTNLSGGHPEPDECDDVVNGGEKGDGVYPVGTIEYPLHPNCLCYKTAVLMEEEEFISKLAAWTRGEEGWDAMDSYASQLGSDQSSVSSVDLSGEPSLLTLAVWMFSQELAL